MLQGQKRPDQRRPHDPVRAGPGGRRPAGRVLHARRATRTAAAHAAGQLRLRTARRRSASRFGLGEGLVGQCALEKQKILLTNVPPDYIRISSGLGEAPPRNILVLPVIFEGQVKRRAGAGLASSGSTRRTRRSSTSSPSRSASCSTRSRPTCGRRTCSSSRSRWPSELQSRQEELQKTNEELQEKARLLADQNEEVERKNQEVEQARQALEEKAKQLALTSQVQVRVPGEHDARAADAAQQPAHPVRPAVEEPRGQPDRPSRPSSPRRSTRRATTC